MLCDLDPAVQPLRARCDVPVLVNERDPRCPSCPLYRGEPIYRIEESMKTDIYQRVMKFAGGDEMGDDRPPAARTLYLGDGGEVPRGTESDRTAVTVVAANNDGTELWIGWSWEWHHHIGSGEVAALLRWLIIDWYLKARWLGLRRPLYYWALRSHLNRWRARRVRTSSDFGEA